MANVTAWAVPLDDKTGEFKRQVSTFRDTISSEPGARHPPEKDRYHLYVSPACPWAHRTLIVRRLKGLEEILTVTSVHWLFGEGGWRFVTPDEHVSGAHVQPDPNHPDFTHLRQIYFESDPSYSLRFTVPVLYDKKLRRIVNNESADIVRMLNHAFDDLLPQRFRDVDLAPERLRAKIDEANAWLYDAVNNGVYKAGVATAQDVYERAVRRVFAGLDRAEAQLAASPGPYFFGEDLTETDVRLYATLVRFDPVYVQHFKTNLRDIRSGYPALHRWLRALYWDVPAFGETTDFDHIKWHYTKSHPQINPYGITPLGPDKHILGKDEEVAAVVAARAAK